MQRNYVKKTPVSIDRLYGEYTTTVSQFGLIYILQIPLIDLSLFFIFIVVGIGIDDVIVVVAFFQTSSK